MQKKLIVAALAGLAAAPAFAQSNVTVYGRVDVGYRSLETETTVRSSGAKSTEKVTSMGGASSQTTSRLGFRGTEDLGNGLKANFAVEYALARVENGESADTATPITNRLMNAGLSGNFGSITLGRQWNLAENVWGFGTASDTNNVRGSLYNSTLFDKGHPTRESNAITYSSPSMSGLVLSAQYASGNTENSNGDNGTENVGLNAVYKTGPLAIAAGYNKTTAKTATVAAAAATPTKLAIDAAAATETETTAMNIGANYNFGAAKVFGLYADAETENKVSGVKTSERDGFELGVIVPVGATQFVASYFDAQRKEPSSVKVDFKGYQLGALYSLSKRTTAYALYGNEEAKSSTATNSKVDYTQYAIGIRHDF